MNEQYELFQDLVKEIRQWDRLEHNWQINQRMEVKNITTKEGFIKYLMARYQITKKLLP